jgi:hypothetical protein|nr:hypothetical protein [uncultured Flavobacterium sp.]
MGKVFNGLQNNKNISSLFIIVLFTFFSSTTVFGQNESLEVSNEKVLNTQNYIVIESPAKVSNSDVNSNVNFILWFMGTKEDMGKTFSNDDVYSKKSFLTSGREPNRLMVKTLLKKALNIKSC